ncbi:hypothetical protein ACNKHU_13805 [Shigella flexneri]
MKLSTWQSWSGDKSIEELGEMLLASFEKHPLRHHLPPFAGFARCRK